MRSYLRASASCLVLFAGAALYACASDETGPFETDGTQLDAGGDATKDRSAPPVEDGGDEEPGTDGGAKDAGKDSGSGDAGKSDGGDAGKTDGGGGDAGPTTKLFYAGDFADNVTNVIGRALVPVGGGAATTGTVATNSTVFALTPDGTKLVFASDKDVKDRFDLHVANADGTGDVVRVTMPAARKVTDVAISPDGASIAYIADGETAGQSDVYVVTLAGASAPVLVSPNGTRANVDLDAQAIAWSRDSKYVAMSGDFTTDKKNELYVVDVTAGTPVAVAALADADIPAPPGTGTAGVNTGLAPIWTSGGKVCAKADLSGATPAVFRLYCANANGTGFATPMNFPAAPAQVGTYGISPDGATIAFSADSAAAANAYEVFTMPADDTAAPTRVTSGTIAAPAGFRGPDFSTPLRFSPDGTKIAFMGDLLVDNRYELFVVAANGTATEKRVALVGTNGDDARDIRSFAWAPDGSALAFVADHRKDNDFEVFRTLDVTTADQAPILVQAVVTGGDIVDGSPLDWRP